jgi:2-hydroxy-3-oxopropionate reductase
MLDRRFEPGGRVKSHYKDLDIALAIGKEFNIPLPLTAQVHEMFNALLAAGKSDLDHSSLVMLLEEMAQIKVQPKNKPD